MRRKIKVFVALAGQTDWQNLFCFVRDNFTGCDLGRVWEHRDEISAVHSPQLSRLIPQRWLGPERRWLKSSRRPRRQPKNRAALTEQIQQARETLEKLLQSAPVERDRFVSRLYQARREYRRTCETIGKSDRQIERCAISTFQVAESMGFKGDFRQWEDLLRIGD